MDVQEHSQTPCPVCGGIGCVRAVRIDGAIKILTYVCESCQRSWNGLERRADEAQNGDPEPPMIRE